MILNNFDYVYMVWVFFLGVILTIAYQTEEIIEQKMYETTSKTIIILLLFVKALIGGILIVFSFFALEEIGVKFTIYSFNVEFGTVTNLLVASVICLWGSDFYRVTHGVLKKKGEVIK